MGTAPAGSNSHLNNILSSVALARPDDTGPGPLSPSARAEADAQKLLRSTPAARTNRLLRSSSSRTTMMSRAGSQILAGAGPSLRQNTSGWQPTVRYPDAYQRPEEEVAQYQEQRLEEIGSESDGEFSFGDASAAPEEPASPNGEPHESDPSMQTPAPAPRPRLRINTGAAQSWRQSGAPRPLSDSDSDSYGDDHDDYEDDIFEGTPLSTARTLSPLDDQTLVAFDPNAGTQATFQNHGATCWINASLVEIAHSEFYDSFLQSVTEANFDLRDTDKGDDTQKAKYPEIRREFYNSLIAVINDARTRTAENPLTDDKKMKRFIRAFEACEYMITANNDGERFKVKGIGNQAEVFMEKVFNVLNIDNANRESAPAFPGWVQVADIVTKSEGDRQIVRLPGDESVVQFELRAEVTHDDRLHPDRAINIGDRFNTRTELKGESREIELCHGARESMSHRKRVLCNAPDMLSLSLSRMLMTLGEDGAPTFRTETNPATGERREIINEEKVLSPLEFEEGRYCYLESYDTQSRQLKKVKYELVTESTHTGGWHWVGYTHKDGQRQCHNDSRLTDENYEVTSHAVLRKVEEEVLQTPQLITREEYLTQEYFTDSKMQEHITRVSDLGSDDESSGAPYNIKNYIKNARLFTSSNPSHTYKQKLLQFEFLTAAERYLTDPATNAGELDRLVQLDIKWGKIDSENNGIEILTDTEAPPAQEPEVVFQTEETFSDHFMRTYGLCRSHNKDPLAPNIKNYLKHARLFVVSADDADQQREIQTRFLLAVEDYFDNPSQDTRQILSDINEEWGRLDPKNNGAAILATTSPDARAATGTTTTYDVADFNKLIAEYSNVTLNDTTPQTVQRAVIRFSDMLRMTQQTPELATHCRSYNNLRLFLKIREFLSHTKPEVDDERLAQLRQLGFNLQVTGEVDRQSPINDTPFKAKVLKLDAAAVDKAIEVLSSDGEGSLNELIRTFTQPS